MTLSNNNAVDYSSKLTQLADESLARTDSNTINEAADSKASNDEDTHTQSNLKDIEPTEPRVTITALSDDVVVATVNDVVVESIATTDNYDSDVIERVDKDEGSAHDDEDDDKTEISNDEILDAKLEEAIAITVDNDNGIDIDLDLEEITELAKLVYSDSEQNGESNNKKNDEQISESETFEDSETAKEVVLDKVEALRNQEAIDKEDEDKKAFEEKEAKLESYKQFVAEQFSNQKVDHPQVRVTIEANALPSRMYFVMNILSAVIASYGLVVNSAAVVIGAMLVAMMLGPITGAALAIIDHRMPLLRKSLLTVLAGVSLVVLVGFLVGLLHSNQPLTAEILSRTQPTSMDLMIALAGGTAGAYAMVSPHLSVAVVGVAVATALVPPLAASGILFAHSEFQLGLGALLLAVTNIIAIQFTNALVLWLLGFRRLVNDDYKSNTYLTFFRRNAVTLLLLAGLGTYLTINLQNNAKQQTFENNVKDAINDYFLDKGNVLTNTQFATASDNQVIRAVIRGNEMPTSYDVRQIEAIITKGMGANFPNYLPIRLQLRYLPVQVIEADPFLTDPLDETDAAILTN